MGDASSALSRPTMPPPSPARVRAPLGDLPLAMFLYPNNDNINTTPGFPPSPVSLPLKRGSAAREAEAESSTGSTQKRRSSERDREALLRTPRVSALGEDDLGTGKSPARRLFTESPASALALAPATPSSHPLSTSRTFAPSPPLSGTGTSASPTAKTSKSASAKATTSTTTNPSTATITSTVTVTSSSTSTSTMSAPTPRRSTRLANHESVHDPGFVVLSDDDPRARPHKPTAQLVFARPEADQENVPPPLSSVPASPHTGPAHRRKFERSKLGTHVTALTSSSPPRNKEAKKEAMKLEADCAE